MVSATNLKMNLFAVKAFQTKEVKEETITSKFDTLISKLEVKLTLIGQKFF